MSIYDKYIEKTKLASDISEHLETLYTYAKECDIIVEFGVADVRSTYALLAAKPKKMTSYDIYRSSNIDECIRLCKEENINFQFKKESSIECRIGRCDLLFIDSKHTYSHLSTELLNHQFYVNKYIIIHDTVSFGEIGEDGEKGLNFAIDDFIINNPQWDYYKTYYNNNGLSVLRRDNES